MLCGMTRCESPATNTQHPSPFTYTVPVEETWNLFASVTLKSRNKTRWPLAQFSYAKTLGHRINEWFSNNLEMMWLRWEFEAHTHLVHVLFMPGLVIVNIIFHHNNCRFCGYITLWTTWPLLLTWLLYQCWCQNSVHLDKAQFLTFLIPVLLLLPLWS